MVPPTLSTVDKAFRVLELIAESRSGYTLTELVRKLKISMGAAQRITQTLMALQYLYKEPRSKALHLTPKIFLYGLSFLSQSEIREIALPYMRRLNEDLDEIVNLAVRFSDEEVVYVERVDKTSGVKLSANLRVGSRRPIHANAIGKVILAFLPEADQHKILDHLYSANYQGKTYCGKNELTRTLQNIRRLGYSFNKSDLFHDILALAVPILNHQSQPVAGINIVLPRLTPYNEIRRKYIPRLIEAGKNISRALGNNQENGFFNPEKQTRPFLSKGKQALERKPKKTFRDERERLVPRGI